MKKILALTLVFCLLSGSSVFAIPYDEYMNGRHEYTSAAYDISPGLTYTEYLTDNAKYGYQRSYVYEYTPMQGTTIIPSIGNYVYGTTSLESITKELEKKGVRVVGGINGDFYSMTTGVPIGAMIIDREIYSSDNDRTAMGFDADGKAFISKPQIVTTLKNDSGEIKIEHINKYPLEYSLYLLTDRFYPTTKTTLASTEIILMPYTDVKTYETSEDAKEDETEEEETEYFWYYPKAEEEPENEDVTSDAENKQTEQNTGTESSEAAAFWDGVTDEKGDTEETEKTEENETLVEDDANTDENKEETEVKDDGNEENNSEDNETDEKVETDEKESDAEAVPKIFVKKYTVSDEKLTIGCDIKVVVKEIRTDSKDSEIPEGCFVLCAENVYQLPRVEQIREGDEFTLSVSANEQWYDAVHAIGNTGGLILKDGEYCDDVEIDHYPYNHPRTAAGITADGRVIFYCVDGRQSSSGGLRIDQLSHEMKELGCVIAMNLDGGGSTTAYAALPGESFSTLKNSPSGMVERKTANSLVFINTSERQNKPSRFTIFPERPYVLAGGSEYVLPKPSVTDENYHPIDVPDDFVYEYYISPIQTDSKIIDGNKFVSGEKCGAVKIYIHVETDGQTMEYQAGTVYVLSDISDFSFEADEYKISPFESLELGFSAGYHTAALYYDKNSLRWSIPSLVKETDEEKADEAEEEKSEETDEADESEEEYYYALAEGSKIETDYGILENCVFTPKTHGKEIVIAANFGDLKDSVKIVIDSFPFDDSFSHWSAKNLYEMHGLELMQGEESENGFSFVPDRQMTRTEFLTVLSRMLFAGIDDEPETKESLEDERKNEDENQKENEEITEETEANEETEEPSDKPFSDKTEEEPKISEDEETKPQFSFSDAADIPEWALKYYQALSETGLLDLIESTYENGDVKIYPTRPITRYDVLVLLGAMCETAEEDHLSKFDDSNAFDESPHRDLINNAVAAGIFEGYEDNTLRSQNVLTRAEAATVVLRFYRSVIEKEKTE